MVFLKLVQFLLFSAGISSAQVLCDFQPIALPITDVDFNSSGVARGIAMSFGTPPKEYAFQPKMDVNNSWIFDTGGSFCPSNSTSSYCNAFRGGIFDYSSTSFSLAANVIAAGGPAGDNDTIDVGLSVGGSDTFQVGLNATLARFPMGFSRYDWGGGTYPLNSIGLDFNSTLLSWLKAAGYIGSRTYSFYWGLAGATGAAKMDGSMVLGGYDYDKVRGQKYQRGFGSREICETGMTVQVTDIQLNFPNGTNSSITPGQSINTCIVPDFPGVMSLPNLFYSNFEKLTNTTRLGQSVGINYGGILYPPNAVFDGDLTITIASTLMIRIPNSQLVQPELILDQNGNPQFNGSNFEVLINPISGNTTSNMPKLGRQFFTAAYLTVNQDERAFALFQANPTNSVHLIAIKDPTCQATNTSTPGNYTTSATPGASAKNQGSKVSRNGIIGAAIGGFVALGLAITLIIFLISSHRKRRNTTSDDILLVSPTSESKREPPPQEIGDPSPQELTAYSPKQEMLAGGMEAEMAAPWSPLSASELPATPFR